MNWIPKAGVYLSIAFLCATTAATLATPSGSAIYTCAYHTGIGTQVCVGALGPIPDCPYSSNTAGVTARVLGIGPFAVCKS